MYVYSLDVLTVLLYLFSYVQSCLYSGFSTIVVFFSEITWIGGF